MENFIVSARKYRPATFDTVVGQASITTTLKNAIRNNHLAQAYLFCGPRGVGKTTCARIFAKTINCLNLSPQTEPCNQCESCKSFNDSRSYNIHELDAASNNSVDDIRTLCEQVRIPPQIGKYSVYIIDEVHMLSTAAFNAFLKTLEEPPKHAIFILATTEKHKIIPTILSRCQIFDFNRIRIDDTVKYLEKISANENNEYEVDGLNIIAQKADGAMRDALSIYDQIVSFSGGKITYMNVIENLNVLDYDYFFKLTDAFLSGNIASSYIIFDEILSKGFDAHNFIVGLSKHFRDLLVCKDTVTLQLLEVGANIKEKYKQQSAICANDFIFEALNILGQCDVHFKSARNQRLHVELTLVQLSLILEKKKTSDQLKQQAGSEKHVIKATPGASVSSTAKATPLSQPTQQTSSGSAAGKVNIPNFVPPTPSIKNLINSAGSATKAKAEPQPEIKNEPVVNPQSQPSRTNTFTAEQAAQAVQQYAESIKTDKPRIFSAFATQTPKLLNNSVVELTLSNQAQLDDFNKNLKFELVNYIRNFLQNDDVSVEFRIEEQHEQTLIYTTEDKYKHMVAKNPNLDKLRKQLNLDFE